MGLYVEQRVSNPFGEGHYGGTVVTDVPREIGEYVVDCWDFLTQYHRGRGCHAGQRGHDQSVSRAFHRSS
jgi:hypothetical protein